jgi:hypothetical protein
MFSRTPLRDRASLVHGDRAVFVMPPERPDPFVNRMLPTMLPPVEGKVLRSSDHAILAPAMHGAGVHIVSIVAALLTSQSGQSLLCRSDTSPLVRSSGIHSPSKGNIDSPTSICSFRDRM